MKIRNEKDFFAGLSFLLIGGFFAFLASGYKFGSTEAMGPGFFPLLLGFLLIGVGIAVAFSACSFKGESNVDEDGALGGFAWRPLLQIIGANLVFGVLLGGLPKLGLPSFGLIAAIYALTLMAYGADGKFRFREGLILSSLLAVGSYLVFICLLKMQIPLWPAFLKF